MHAWFVRGCVRGACVSGACVRACVRACTFVTGLVVTVLVDGRALVRITMTRVDMCALRETHHLSPSLSPAALRRTLRVTDSVSHNVHTS